MSAVGRLFRASGWYLGGEILSRAVAFALIPVWTHYLSPAQFGVFELLRMLSPMLAVIASMGLGAAVTRKSVGLDEGPAGQLAFSVLVVQLGTLVGLAVVFETAGSEIFAAVFDRIPYVPYGRLGFWAALCTSAATVSTALMILHERAALLSSLTAAATLITAGLSLLLVIGFGQGVGGLLGAYLIGQAVVLLPHAGYLVKRLRWSFSGRWVAQSLVYGAPLMPHLIAHYLLGNVDRYLLERMRGLTELGIYGSAYVFGTGLMMVNLALNKAYAPFTYKLADAYEADPASESGRTALQQLRLGAFGLAAVVLAGAAGVAALGPLVVHWLMDPAYSAASSLVPWIAVGLGLHGLYLIWANLLFYAHRTAVVPLLSGVAAVCNLGLNLWWIPDHGALGAAIATTISYAVLAALTWLTARRIVPLSLTRRQWVIIGLLVACVLLGFGVQAAPLSPVWRALAQLGVAAAAGGVALSPAVDWWRVRRSRAPSPPPENPEAS